MRDLYGDDPEAMQARERAEAAICMVWGMTRWQRVIHGQSESLRRRYVEWLNGTERTRRALAYAMCGMGDQIVEQVDGTVRVKPFRCGDRFCPRCSRYRGWRIVNRVTEHLRRGPHGAVFHMVFTQRVRKGESLGRTRGRFEEKWARLSDWFRRTGFIAGLRTTHITWSRFGGWHVHAHVIAEFDNYEEETERVVAVLLERWKQQVEAEGGGPAADMFARPVAEKGEAFAGLEASQTEFWEETEDPVARALQYCVRDVCQGVESWNLEGAGNFVEELFAGIGGAKLHRLLGQWRRTPDDRWGGDSEDKADADAGDGVVDVVGGELVLGTVDAVVYAALGGDGHSKEVLRWLLDSVKNMSSVAARMQEELALITRS